MKKNIICAMASLAFIPAASFAAAPTLSDVLDASGISISGHASGSYVYTHDEGADSKNTFQFDQAELTVSRLPAEGFGGLVDVYAGQDVAGGSINFGSGFNTFGAGGEFNLHQAYVQYSTGGLTVIGGKFATLAGYEVASDALNSSGIRSVLFRLQPFTLTGARASYKFNDMVTVYAGLSNSATLGSTTDVHAVGSTASDDQKTGEFGLALAPLKGLTVNLTDYYGIEGTSTKAKTNLLDLVAAYRLGDLSVGFNGDYFTSKAAGVRNTTAGAALYLGYQVTSAFRTMVRGEFVETRDSPLTSKNRITEVTLTGGYDFNKNFSLIGDALYAWNNPMVPAAATTGGTIAQVKAIYKF